jgi:catechol 2,3-dioxygenase-like lactoylglutathione lyase family enzyme
MAFTMYHAGFSVGEMDRSLGFYRDLLGLEVVLDAVRENLPTYDAILGFPDSRLRVVQLEDRNGPFRLELIEYLNPRRQERELKNTWVGAAHMGFYVANLEAEYERLLAAGVRFNSPPQEIVREGKLVGKALYMLDPDGITVELFQLA